MGNARSKAEAGAAVYSSAVLRVYDWFVLGFSNRRLWRCPTREILALYDRFVSADHLDCGVGSGYFLDRCRFPSAAPRLTLLDLSPTALAHCQRRLARYQPRTLPHNVLEPLPEPAAFGSISLSYLLHCVPGALRDKAVIFDHLAAALAPGGAIFGATLLPEPPSRAARWLMDTYNRKQIFSNRDDTLEDLRHALEQRFDEVALTQHGCGVLFSARGRAR